VDTLSSSSACVRLKGLFDQGADARGFARRLTSLSRPMMVAHGEII
jgi:hypothetical protein